MASTQQRSLRQLAEILQQQLTLTTTHGYQLTLDTDLDDFPGIGVGGMLTQLHPVGSQTDINLQAPIASAVSLHLRKL